jgi:hypothetical protein
MQPYFDPTKKMTSTKNGRQPQKKEFKNGRRPQKNTKKTNKFIFEN